MGFALALALAGCDSNGGRGGSSGSSEPSASVDELKFNPTDVESELRSQGKNPTEVRAYSNGGNGMNLFGYPVFDGCGYNAFTDQYICTDDSYVKREYQNLGITKGEYTINTVVVEEDVYNVDHYSPLRIVNDPYYREPSRGWWPSGAEDNGYDYSKPSSGGWGNSGSNSDNYDNSGSSGSDWGSSGNSGSSSDNYDNSGSSGWGSSGSSSSGSDWGSSGSSSSGSDWGSSGSSSSGSDWGSSGSSSSGSDWGSSGSSSSGSDWGSSGSSSSGSDWGSSSSSSGSSSDNYGDNILTPFLALANRAEAYPVSSRTIVYDSTGRYYTIGAQQYAYQSSYTVPYIISLGYTKDWIDYMQDYNMSQSSLHVYYTKAGQTRDVEISVNGPLNSNQRTWVRGQHSGTTSDIETLSKILQGTYVPPAPPAPVTPTTTPSGSSSDNYGDAASTTGSVPATTTTTPTTTTTVEQK
jgi:hypothetical protein